MNQEVAVQAPRVSLIGAMAAKYSIEPAKFLATMKATVFDGKASDEEMIAFLAVANRYDLDPFRKEVFAFRKGSEGGGVQPIVSVDGWSSIANRQPQYDGVDFEDRLNGDKLVSITCRIHRKDRARPTEVTEYLSECKRNTMPWNQWPARMLRHKAFIQCVRLAFGISGIMEPDEAERMVDAQIRVLPPAETASEAPVKSIADLKAKVKKEKEPAPVAEEAQPVMTRVEAILPEQRAKNVEIAAKAAPKPDSAALLTAKLKVMEEQLGEGMFGEILKRYGAQRDLIQYGVGSDTLKSILAECERAIG